MSPGRSPPSQRCPAGHKEPHWSRKHSSLVSQPQLCPVPSPAPQRPSLVLYKSRLHFFSGPIQDPSVNGDTLGAHGRRWLWDGRSWAHSLESCSALADISPCPSPAVWAMLGLLPARPALGSIAAVPELLRTKCSPLVPAAHDLHTDAWGILAGPGVEGDGGNGMGKEARLARLQPPKSPGQGGPRWPDKGHQPGCPHSPCSGVRDVPRHAAPSCPVCLSASSPFSDASLVPPLTLFISLFSCFSLPAGVLEERG